VAVSFSIKDVSDELAEALRERARSNHRSVQGELMAMLEAHVSPRPFRARALLAEVRRLGVRTSGGSADMIRADRDRR
jgi:antitoxin FitA